MLNLESPPQITSLSTKFMHERGGVPQLDKYLDFRGLTVYPYRAISIWNIRKLFRGFMLTRYGQRAKASRSATACHVTKTTAFSKARNDWTTGDRWTYLAWSSHIQSGQLRSRRIILTSRDPLHGHDSEIHALTVTATSWPRPAHHTTPHLTSHQPAHHLSPLPHQSPTRTPPPSQTPHGQLSSRRRSAAGQAPAFRCMTARDCLRAWDVNFFGSSNLTHKSCGIFVASWGFAHCIGTRLVFHNFFIST